MSPGLVSYPAPHPRHARRHFRLWSRLCGSAAAAAATPSVTSIAVAAITVTSTLTVAASTTSAPSTATVDAVTHRLRARGLGPPLTTVTPAVISTSAVSSAPVFCGRLRSLVSQRPLQRIGLDFI